MEPGTPGRKPNTSGRAFWVMFCLLWAWFWFILLIIAPAREDLFPFVMTIGSVLAIAIPVGRR